VFAFCFIGIQFITHEPDRAIVLNDDLGGKWGENISIIFFAPSSATICSATSFPTCPTPGSPSISIGSLSLGFLDLIMVVFIIKLTSVWLILLYFPYLSSREKRAGCEYFVVLPHNGHISFRVYLPQEHLLILDTITSQVFQYFCDQAFSSVCLWNSPVPPTFSIISMAAFADFLRKFSAFL